MVLKFHWMRKPCSSYCMEDMFVDTPQSVLNKQGDVPLSQDQEPPLFEDLREYDEDVDVNDGIAAIITADTMDELPDYQILQLQWDVIRMASLCGGAQPYLSEESNWDQSNAWEYS
jgi:hypothetical protein